MIRKINIIIIYISLIIFSKLSFAQSLSATQIQPTINKLPNNLIIITYFKHGEKYKTKLIAFNEVLYTKAYKSFLNNQNIKDAYVIALAAVTQEPSNIEWRKHLLQIALWNELPKVALENAFYLAKKNDLNALNTAITIAQQLNNNSMLAKLYQIKVNYNKNDTQAWLGLIHSEEAIGTPEKIIQRLKKTIIEEPKLFYYLQLAKLYQNIGDITAAEKILNTAVKKYGPTPEIATQQAEFFYSQGKINTAYQKLLAALPVAQQHNELYWKTLGELSWTLQNFKLANLAYKNIKNLSERDLFHFIRLQEQIDPQRAVKLSLEGWHKYKNLSFLLTITNIVPKTKQWHLLAEILASIPKSVIKKLRQFPYYMTTEARMWGELGYLNKASEIYQLALKKYPDSQNLQYDYLWFLIDFNLKQQLALQLTLWHKTILKHQQLWQPAAAGFMLLKEPKIALAFYQKQYKTHKNDYIWLLQVADALEMANESLLAYEVKHRAWKLVLQKIVKQKSSITPEDLVNYSILAIDNAPSDWTHNLMTYLATNSELAVSSDTLMSWALANNNDEFVEYMWRFYDNKNEAPLWVQQTIALHNNDLPQLQKLLTLAKDKLPYRDRVIAASRAGQERLAQNLAYQGLSDNPEDSDMYDIFADTMLKAANSVTFNPYYKQFGYVVGPDTKLQATLFITPRTSITPFSSLWDLRSWDTTEILTPMNYSRIAGLKAKTLYNKGFIEAVVGQRQSLSSFWFGTLKGTYRFTSKLNSSLALDYNQLSDETTPLLIAGMVDDIKLSIDYQYTVRDLFNATIIQTQYKSQDQTKLGSGQSATIFYNHKFELGYPDWNYTLFASTNRFYHSGKLSRRAQTIIPPEQPANLNFYLPKNFNRYGLSVGVGQAYFEEYTHAWRPFAEASAFNNTRFGLGSYINIGIAGSVFGRDHLALYYTRSIGIEASDQEDYEIGLSYNYYF